jgi:hypothetical protein
MLPHQQPHQGLPCLLHRLRHLPMLLLLLLLELLRRSTCLFDPNELME